MSNTPDLYPVAAGTGRSLVARKKAQIQSPLTNAVWVTDASTSFQLNAKCQDFINRYLGRSLITPDNPKMIKVNRKLLELAFTVSLYINPVLSTRMEAGMSSWSEARLTFSL
jgi:hypothetical protein